MSYLQALVMAASALLISTAKMGVAHAEDVTQKCHIDGYEAWANCGTIDVPLDWSGETEGRLKLFYVVIPAKSDQGLPPLFALAGGPGQAITETGQIIKIAFDKVGRTRDLVLMDQRGTGRSHPMACSIPEDLNFIMTEATIKEQAQNCLKEQTEDTRYFNSSQAVKDLNAMRVHLGVDKIALWGGSYGTRMALLYMKDYPQHVEATVLDGVAPAHKSFLESSSQHAQAALDQLFNDCEADTLCATAYPKLRASFKVIQTNLNTADKPFPFQDPITGHMVEMLPTPLLITQVIRGMLYSSGQSAYLPYAITEAAKENYGPLSALGSQPQHTEKQMMYMGMTFSTICPEDVARAKAEGVKNAARGAFGQDYFYKFFKTSCDNWVFGPSTGTDNDPENSAIPVLMLSGDVDPITAPEMAESLMPRFTNAKHFVASNNGHIVSMTPCAVTAMDEFYRHKKPNEIDGQCFEDIKRPPFYISGSTNLGDVK